MVSPFLAALAAADVHLDAHLGEAVSVVPMRGGEFASTYDTARPTFDVVALVSDTMPSAVNAPHLEARVVHEEYEVDIRRAVLAGRTIKKGDELILLDRPGSVRLIVNFLKRNDETRLCLVCGPIAS